MTENRQTLRMALVAAVVAFAFLLPGAVTVYAAAAGDITVICDREIAPYRAVLDVFPANPHNSLFENF